MSEIYDSIWDALEDTPQASAAMTMRAKLMHRLCAQIGARGWSIEDAARAMRVDPARIVDLERGRIDALDVEMLADMARAAGLRVDIVIEADAVS